MLLFILKGSDTMLGDKLRNLRTDKHLTQQQIADKLGLTRPAYTAYETNKRTPDANMLKELSDIFEVSADYLLGINQTPQWATPKDSLDFKEFMDGNLNPAMSYDGENLTDDQRNKLKQALGSVFWEEREKERNRGNGNGNHK